MQAVVIRGPLGAILRGRSSHARRSFRACGRKSSTAEAPLLASRTWRKSRRRHLVVQQAHAVAAILAPTLADDGRRLARARRLDVPPMARSCRPSLRATATLNHALTCSRRRPCPPMTRSTPRRRTSSHGAASARVIVPVDCECSPPCRRRGGPCNDSVIGAHAKVVERAIRVSVRKCHVGSALDHPRVPAAAAARLASGDHLATPRHPIVLPHAQKAAARAARVAVVLPGDWPKPSERRREGGRVDVGPLTLGGVLAAARHDAEKIDVACLESEMCEALVDAPLAQRAHEAEEAHGEPEVGRVGRWAAIATTRSRFSRAACGYDDTVSVATSATSTAVRNSDIVYR